MPVLRHYGMLFTCDTSAQQMVFRNCTQISIATVEDDELQKQSDRRDQLISPLKRFPTAHLTLVPFSVRYAPAPVREKKTWFLPFLASRYFLAIQLNKIREQKASNVFLAKRPKLIPRGNHSF